MKPGLDYKNIDVHGSEKTKLLLALVPASVKRLPIPCKTTQSGSDIMIFFFIMIDVIVILF